MSVVKAREIESEEEIQRIYNWMDDIQLSRPRKNISRDFADGLLCAEVLCQYFPRLVDLHNYSAANSYAQKMYNWNTMNKKVLKKLGFQLHPSDIEDVIKAVPGAVEKVLVLMQHYMARYKRQQEQGESVAGTPAASARGSASASSAPRGGSQQGGATAAASSRVSANGQQQSASMSGNVVGGSSSGGGAASASTGSNGTRVSAGGGQQNMVSREILQREQEESSLTIQELRETILLMSEKIKKLEQLVRIKDAKIDGLQTKLASIGGGGGGVVAQRL
ncbi:unnamed protein product [Amoebophrya sp. A25]|nr:unnamed protein product [Amoebophrya sp. A25]|eukprot:GSA25T00024051001.1